MPLSIDLVETVLLAWEKVFYPQHVAAGRVIVDADLVDLWHTTLSSESVTDEEFKHAAVALQRTSEFFPKPGGMLAEIASLREARLRLKRALYYASLIRAIDEQGRELLAPYWRVRNGKLLPPGERNTRATKPPALVDIETGRSRVLEVANDVDQNR